jgi:hypothetical protein
MFRSSDRFIIVVNGYPFAEKKFGKAARGILTVGGAEVEDIEVIRDGDHLFFSW